MGLNSPSDTDGMPTSAHGLISDSHGSADAATVAGRPMITDRRQAAHGE
jgi:hypothetical protein